MNCLAQVHRHSGNYGCVGNPRKYRTGQCERRGRTVLLNNAEGFGVFCKQHANLALEGFIDKSGQMPSPGCMADYRRYPATRLGARGLTPPERGVWARAVREEN